jgi:hypothetical protein
MLFLFELNQQHMQSQYSMSLVAVMRLPDLILREYIPAASPSLIKSILKEERCEERSQIFGKTL